MKQKIENVHKAPFIPGIRNQAQIEASIERKKINRESLDEEEKEFVRRKNIRDAQEISQRNNEIEERIRERHEHHGP